MYTRYPFWCCGIPRKIPPKTVCVWWCIFNAFVPMCALYFCTIHGQNNTHKWYTEGFISVASLKGVVGLPSSFIRSFIDSTRKIWYIVYINAKWIYASETLVCIISECSILCNITHVTSTCPFISWCSGAANVKRTPQV